jgi:(p)ppGpp synthase/HD superfamily hydrolase
MDREARSSASAAPTLTFAHDLPLTQDAIAFARARHRGQRRASDGAPFLIHPLEVASLLERSSYPDQVIAAGVLHDVLEDTDAERGQLEERFGSGVAELVALVSDDPEIGDEEARKSDVRERVRRAGGDGLIIYAADKVSKVRELRMLLASGMDPEQAAIKRRRYEASLAMLESEAPAERLVELLRFELEALHAFPPTSPT